LEIRLKFESFQPFIDFLAFLIEKLWQNNQNLGTKSFWEIFAQNCFFLASLCDSNRTKLSSKINYLNVFDALLLIQTTNLHTVSQWKASCGLTYFVWLL